MPLNDDSIQSFSQSQSIGFIKKDLKFFKYKLRDPEVFFIRIDGFSLLIKPKIHLYIGDAGYFDKSKTADFLKVLKHLANILGCGNTIIACSKNHWLYEYMISAVQPEDSLPIGFLLIDDEITLEKIAFTQCDYDTF